MKTRHELAIFIILALTIVLSAVLVSATWIPIGDSRQTVPFESSPTAHSISGDTTALVYPQRAYDTMVVGTTARCMMRSDYTRNLTYSGFERASDLGLEEFTVGWVDFKIRYDLPTPTVEDRFRFTYKVGASGEVILQDWINGTTEYGIVGPDTLAQTWHNPPEPLDGTWTWSDIASLSITVHGENVTDDAKYLYLYEIWLSVYPLPLPPSASTAVSIQPTCVAPIELWGDPDFLDIIFVDVYVKDIERLAGWEFVMHFDTTVLTPHEGWVYWPFTDVAMMTLDDAGGLVNIAASIDINSPIVYEGWNGSTPLARVYFGVEVDGFTWLTFSKMKTSDPAPTGIPHADHHGCYGTPPVGEHLLVWQSTSEFNWSDPICSWWTEDCPEHGVVWHLTSWDDNGDERFTPSDQIDMEPEPNPTNEVWWYHVNATGVVTPSANVYMIVTFKYTTPKPEFPLGMGIMMMIALLMPLIYLWRRKGWKK